MSPEVAALVERIARLEAEVTRLREWTHEVDADLDRDEQPAVPTRPHLRLVRTEVAS